VGADRALKRLDLLRVEDAMLTDPTHCHMTDNAQSVAHRMQEDGLNYLLVCSAENRLEGYVAYRDIVDHEGPISDRVKPMTLTVSPRQNLKDALSKMLTYDIGVVVAVDDDHRLKGVLNTMTLARVVGQTYDEKGGRWGKVTAGGRIL
jgi:osmoprotectant transport system ATP-binding protein